MIDDFFCRQPAIFLVRQIDDELFSYGNGVKTMLYYHMAEKKALVRLRAGMSIKIQSIN